MVGKTDFGKLNNDIVQAEEAREAYKSKGSFTKVKWLKIPYGDTIFTVLPPFDENSHIYKEVYLHYGFVDDKGSNRVYKCSTESHGSCPICENNKARIADGNEKKASEQRAQKFFLYNLGDYNLENRIGALKPSQHNEVSQEINTIYIDDGIDVTDISKGKQIKLSRLKATPWARARVLGKSLDLNEEQVKGLLDGVVNLTTVYIDNTPDELQRMLNGEQINKQVKEGDANGKEGSTDTKDSTTTKNTGTAKGGNGTTAKASSGTEGTNGGSGDVGVKTKSADPELDEIIGLLDKE